MSLGWNVSRRRFAGRGQRMAQWWPVALALGMLLSSWPVAEAQTVVPSVQLDAPRQVNLGAPIKVVVIVRDVADIAGYEANVDFDTKAVELNGVTQRQGDLKSLGRDIHALGPVERSTGISF